MVSVRGSIQPRLSADLDVKITPLARPYSSFMLVHNFQFATSFLRLAIAVIAYQMPAEETLFYAVFPERPYAMPVSTFSTGLTRQFAVGNS